MLLVRATRCHTVPLSDVFQRKLVQWLDAHSGKRAASWFKKYMVDTNVVMLATGIRLLTLSRGGQGGRHGGGRCCGRGESYGVSLQNNQGSTQDTQGMQMPRCLLSQCCVGYSLIVSCFQQRQALPVNAKEAEQGGADGGGDQSARLEADPRGEGLFKTVPDVLEARHRLHARLDKGGKGRRHTIPEGTPVPPPHLRNRSASQPASRIAPLPLETVSVVSSQPAVNSIFVLCCAVLND
jgi:hypothetical protein